MKVNFTLKGLAEWQAQIGKLPEHLHGKAVSRATAKAATLLRDEVKKNTPLAKRGSYAATFRGQGIKRRRGDLAKALILKRIPAGERGDFVSQHKVTFLRNSETQGIGYIAHLLEGDTKPHEIKQKKRTLAHRGTTGSRFFARTLRKNRRNMNKIMEQEILKAIREHFK